MKRFSYTLKIICALFIVNFAINSILPKAVLSILIITMDIFRIDELTDNMMDLSHDEFYHFLEIVLNKDLCQLFRVQAIRDMSSLSNLTVDEITEILNFNLIN
jgi:hypothetical protein